MSVLTTFLKLFKYDNNDKQNNVNFNIETALNANWDKIESNALLVNQTFAKTIYRKNWQMISGTLASYIKTQINSGNVYGSLWCINGSDMNSLGGFVTWKSDTSAGDIVHVELDSANNKKYYRSFAYSTATWIEPEWERLATSAEMEQKADKDTVRLIENASSNLDLNTFVTSKEIPVISPMNAPFTDMAGVFQSIPHSASIGFQTLFHTSGVNPIPQFFFRSRRLDKFSAWKEVATTDKIDILSTDLRNGWSFNSTVTSITKNGNQCTINVILRDGTATVNTVIMNIPEKFRPTKAELIDVMYYNSSLNGANGLLQINTNGDVVILNQPTYTTNVVIARSYNLS